MHQLYANAERCKSAENAAQVNRLKTSLGVQRLIQPELGDNKSAKLSTLNYKK